MNDLRTDLASLKLDRNARRSSGGRGRWLTGVLLLALIGAGWWFWTRPRPTPVKTSAVVSRRAGAQGATDDAVLNASGYVTARRRATVSSRVTGKVVSIHVEEGMAVTQGQVLARLDDSTARAFLQLAEAQLAASRTQLAETEVRIREAEIALGRQQRLAKENLVALADVDTATAQVDALRARLQAARQRIIVNNFMTDTTDWVALADPTLYPSIGLGYRFGRAPELFSVADPNSGLMFSNDVLPVKVRFVYSLGPIDWRGLYKHNVAGD